jgi:hypothetical protein
VPLDEYHRALDAAVKEYERAMVDRAALDARVAQLHETIRTLTRLCGFTPTVPFGLTDACRLVLRNAGTPLTAVQVRERLTAIGFDHEKYANGLAAIHTVLKRLQESGEAALAAQDDVTRQAYAFLGSGLVASRVGPRAAIATRGRSQKTRAPRPVT